MLHFGKTDRLVYSKDIEKDPPRDSLLIGFEGGHHVAFDCQRMLGKVELVEDPDDLLAEEKLGPDALAIDISSLRDRLEGRWAAAKPALMNQRVLTGVGNVYSDEILFQAPLHPKTSVERLDETALEVLSGETNRMMQTAVERRTDSEQFSDSFLLSHRRDGEE